MSIRGLILCSMMAGCSLLSTPEAVPLPDAGQVVPDAGVTPVDPCEPNPCTDALKTQCAAVEGRAVCSCDEGAQAVGDVCLPLETCDDGDCVGGAMVVARGATVEGTLNRNGGDGSDWYRLDGVSAGGIERVSVRLIGDSGPDAVREEGEAPPVVPNIKLFVAPEVEVPARAVPRDGVEDDGRFVRLLSAEVEAGAVVLVRIDDADERAVEYALEVAATAQDDHADGDEGATPIEQGETPFILETREDTDTLHITPERAGALLVSVSLNEVAEATGAISLRVGSVGGNDHRRYFGRARHEVLEATTYSIRLNHRDRRLVSGTLLVRLLSDDDHGDRPEEATPISVGRGEIVQGSLEEGGVDWFAFPAQANQVYRVVYNGAGLVQGGRADDEGFVWAHARGDHYRHDGQSSDAVLEVSGSAHEFDLMIMNTELEDPAGNRLSAAALLPDGAGPFEGGLEYRGDVDFYGPIFGDGAGCIGWPGQDGERLQLQALDDQGRVLATAPGEGEQRVGFEEPALFYLSVSLGEGSTASYPLSYSFSYESAACD